jgi:hypothetical protein
VRIVKPADNPRRGIWEIARRLVDNCHGRLMSDVELMAVNTFPKAQGQDAYPASGPVSTHVVPGPVFWKTVHSGVPTQEV